MNDWLVVILLAQALVAATPLVLAGLGELVAERSGVLNIGIEGLVLAGCLAGFATAAATGHPWLAFAAAIGTGSLLALAFGLMTVYARCDQIVSGLALNLVIIGGTGTAWSVMQTHGLTTMVPGSGFDRDWCGGWGVDLPLIGPLLFRQYGLTVVVAILALVTAWILARTRLGLIIRALGDEPDACAAAGVPVRRWRLLAVVGAGAAAGAAGAFLAIMRTNSFVPMMSGGLGFIVLALVMFGRWRVGWMISGCVLFGLADATQQHLQSQAGANRLPYQVWQVIPYATALIVLALMRRGRAGPRALGQPW